MAKHAPKGSQHPDYGRDSLQRFQNLVPPDVTGVKDQIRAFQYRQGFGSHFAVGVCNDADLHRVLCGLKPGQIYFT
jgi:hypothetical protein